MIGDAVDLSGTLVRDGGGFALQQDGGGLVRLDLHRLPVDRVEKRVRVIGTWIGEALVEADGVSAP
ncbi:DUF5818 domain-containing protein [Sphingomonas prati]|uniref:Uncharacterized protein n=1 Tax=Sphingomonas prati TaxID=1843237 RepID=A0A7W9F1V9_9SPHN|nr:DUF5818 domain-containing protein [Sphingomonas prati]MBB5729723.1 hypothetical protein [Sphingomonas prati]GGE89994.1 hypothetical protein GCM10011404_23600 [Sphingomonas prati]